MAVLIPKILWGLSFLTLISGQVNTDTVTIDTDDEDTEEAAELIYTVEWFKPEEMSSFSKLYLCVEVLQKLINVTLIGGIYIPDTPELKLPDFVLINVSIGDPSLIKYAIHCPLNVIKFENILYNYGTEFYVTASATDNCVYALNPIFTSQANNVPTLDIQTEICAILLDARLDNMELEIEFENELIKNGYELLSWPYLDQISNEEKFLMCLDVYGRMTRQTMIGLYYQTNNINNKLPPCKTILNPLTFSSYKGSEYPFGLLSTLHCPMNQIHFLNKKNKKSPISPRYISSFFLARSVNTNCVYKIRASDGMFFIQGEICGIFGTVNTNVEEIETKLLVYWMTMHDLNIITGGDIHLMLPAYQIQLCGNVYRKIYNQNYFHHGRPGKPSSILIIGERNVTTTTLHCYLKKNNSSKSIAIQLVNSVNLGCVYLLEPIKDYQSKRQAVVKISSEVCNVFPVRYLLKISHRKLIQPII